MDKATEVNRAHFDSYWSSKVRLKSYLQYNAVYTRQLIDYGLRKALPERHHKRVLDIGFGIGEHFFLFPPTCALFGTEISQRAIDLTLHEAKRRGYPQMHLRLSRSPTRLEFPDREFDVVICSHVIEHLQDDLGMLSEVRRVLRPQGVAVFQIPLDLFDDKVHPDLELINPDFVIGKSDHVRRYNVHSFSNRLLSRGFEILHQYSGGKPQDLMMILDTRIRQPLRRILPVAERAISALLNIPLALLPFRLKHGLDQMLAPWGLHDHYGLWLARSAVGLSFEAEL